jgi:hypothetical protein
LEVDGFQQYAPYLWLFGWSSWGLSFKSWGIKLSLWW